MSAEKSVSVTEGEEVRVSMVLLTQGETEELLCGPSWGYPGKDRQMECWTRHLLPMGVEEGRNAAGLSDLTVEELFMKLHLQGEKLPSDPSWSSERRPGLLQALDTQSIWNPG